MPNLLIVANCPSENTRKLHQAVHAGACHREISGVETRLREPLEAGPGDVLWADGVILGTTENFGAISGLVKDFLERIYYPCLEKTEGLPAAVYVKGGLDGQGARTGVERILTGLKWKLVRPTLVFKGAYREEFRAQCEELGQLMAAGLEARIF
ncbi:MAG: flavodoxin family protein [Gammaproteobacteria bacterium]|nr:flavodoxin family protein [Gammaproteobacteria bacterium]